MMPRCRRSLGVVLAVGLLLSCGLFLALGRELLSQASYDPKNDPLVNPPRLFEPYPKDHPATVAEDETLVRHLSGNPTNLNPIFSSSLHDGYVADLLFDTLFRFDAKMEWAVNDKVVESCEESPDHLSYTVKIKSGLRWHDGKPFTARDVRFSWEAILDERVPCPAVKTGTDQVTDIKVMDDLNLKFVLKEAMPTNKWHILFPIIPEHIYGKPEERAKDPSLKTGEYYNHYNRTEVVGNGPYRLVEWVTNDRIVVERWEEFHGEKPHFKRQILKIQPDRNIALLLFKKGELDEMELTQQQFATQTSDPQFQSQGVKAYASQWLYAYVGWNMNGSNPFFSDPRVRRAMTHACNIRKMIDSIAYNLATPCYGPFHPESWMFHRGSTLLEYDLKLARRLLDEAGCKVSEEDGWRYKDVGGKSVKFEFTMLIPQGSAIGPKVAAIFGQDLKKIGVSLQTRTVEWATFQEMLRKHEAQAWVGRWGTGTDPDTSWNLWRSDECGKGRNYGCYKNPRVDELYELGRKEFDPQMRAAQYAEVAKLIYEDQPYTFLWNDATLWALQKRLRGIQFSPRGVLSFDPSHMAWWVAKEEKLR